VKTLSKKQDDLDVHTSEIVEEFRRILPRIPNPVYRYLEHGLNYAIRETNNQNSTIMDEEHLSSKGNLEVEARSLTGYLAKQKRSRVRLKTSTSKNIFGTFEVTSETEFLHQTSSKNDDVYEDEDQYEHTTSIKIQPSQWMIRLGIRYRVDATIQHSAQRLRYSLDTVYLVPDDSPIFDFCRKGNINAVRTLLSERQASPWDTDSIGRTPLHVSLVGFAQLCWTMLRSSPVRC